MATTAIGITLRLRESAQRQLRGLPLAEFSGMTSSDRSAHPVEGAAQRGAFGAVLVYAGTLRDHGWWTEVMGGSDRRLTKNQIRALYMTCSWLQGICWSNIF